MTTPLCCPKCGAEELTADKSRLNIRAYKVQLADGSNMSQCLLCKDNGCPDNGWFSDRQIDFVS